MIDKEEISLCGRRIPLSVQATIAPDYLKMWKITQQWIGQLERIGKGLLGKRIIRAYAENLHIKCVELGVVGLPGR